jgi:hypothetical protein
MCRYFVLVLRYDVCEHWAPNEQLVCPPRVHPQIELDQQLHTTPTARL